MQTKSGLWELVVQAKFVKVRGNSTGSAARKAQGIFLNVGALAASDVESEDIEVGVGDYIRIGDPPALLLYEVESIDSNGVVCCKDATDSSHDRVHMSLKEANELYNKYIRY
jgi:hypothetical protein